MCKFFEQCTKRFDKIDSSLEGLEKKLFKGNGTLPWDVRLDRLEQAEKNRGGWAKWRDRAVLTCALGILAKTFYTGIMAKFIS